MVGIDNENFLLEGREVKNSYFNIFLVKNFMLGFPSIDVMLISLTGVYYTQLFFRRERCKRLFYSLHLVYRNIINTIPLQKSKIHPLMPLLEIVFIPDHWLKSFRNFSVRFCWSLPKWLRYEWLAVIAGQQKVGLITETPIIKWSVRSERRKECQQFG